MYNGVRNVTMSRKDEVPALGNLKLELNGQMSKQDLITQSSEGD